MDRDHTKTVPQSKRSTEPTHAPFRAGQVLDDYIVGDVLGEGGMGIVLAARDPDLDRKVAIKVLRREVFGDDGLFAARARLLREAQAMAKLTHPNVITVYRIGVFEEHTFVAMEFVDGGTLRDWVKDKSHDTIIHAYLAAAEGLAAAHAVGLVHRDFKPDNALVGKDGRVRVTDFGLVAAEPGDHDERDLRSISLTHTGAILGTPAYMAPEQHEGQAADARADQFAFCVSLYEALYGERPFASPTFDKLVENVLATRITPPVADNVARHVRRTLVRGMSRDPAKRFSSMRDIIDRLQPSAASRLSAIWDADRRERVRDAFVKTEHARAKETCERVETLLDSWADSWIDRHAEHVRSIRERPPALVDETAAFLDRRLEEFELVIGELERIDAAKVDGAVDIATGLTSVDQLARSIPLPADPAKRAEVAVLAARVEEANAQQRFGRYAEALAIADEVAAAVAATKHPPLVAYHALVHGRLCIRLEDNARAIKSLRVAVEQAARTGDAAIEAAAATWLVQAVSHDPDRVEDLLVGARSAVERARSPLEASRLEFVLAYVAHTHEDYAGARDHYAKAIQIWRDAGEPPTFEIYGTFANYGAMLQNLGDLDGARAAYAKSRELVVATVGTSHPLVGDLETNLGAVESAHNHYANALAHHDGALAVYRRTYGERSARVAVALYNMADMLVRLDREPEAITAYEESLAIRREKFGDTGLPTAETKCRLGMAYVRRGEIEAGGKMVEDGLNIRLRELPADHPDIAEARGLLGLALDTNDQPQEALAEYEAAAAIYEKHGMRFQQAINSHNAGMHYLRNDDMTRAGEWLSTADTLWQSLQPDHPNAIETRFMLAQQRWHIGEQAKARELATAAHEVANGPGRDIIAKWLAER